MSAEVFVNLFHICPRKWKMVSEVTRGRV